ncbi:MAG: SIMPL domain-containing protein [Phycisphaerales bacterium]|nr:SIMPL domain-containing protein [Phycisphaerales bacterium]
MARMMALILMFLMAAAAVCRGGTVSAEAEISGPADRVAVMMFIRQETSENQSGEAALDAVWDRARQWLINNGYKPEQIMAGPVTRRLFNNEQQYLVRRITLVEPVDPAKADQVAEKLARLIDQAMARGLEPASRLMSLDADQQGMMFQSGGVAGQFVFFLPRDPAGLVEQAARKGMEQLRRQVGWLSAAASLPALHPVDLTIDEPAQLESDLSQGRIGINGDSADEVLARVKVTARLSAGPEVGQTLEIVGQGRVETDIGQAVLFTRLAAVNPSYQGAMDDLAEQARRLRDSIKDLPKAQLTIGGVALFSGYVNGINIGGNAADGQLPGGAYREARIKLVREAQEGEADFRIRVGNLVRVIRGDRVDRPYQPPAVLALWGAADEGAWMSKAMSAAVDDARQRAQRHAATLGLKLGAILDAGPASQPESSPMTMLLSQFLRDNPHPRQRESAGIMVRFGEKPVLNVPLAVRFAVEPANQYNPTP